MEAKIAGSPWEVEVRDAAPTLTTTATTTTTTSAATTSAAPMSGPGSTKSAAAVRGEGVRHFAAGQIAAFELDLTASPLSKDDVHVSILSPSKRQLSSRVSFVSI